MTNLVLEKYWDQMLPGWDHEELSEEEPHYRLFAAADTYKHGLTTLAGQPFKCHLCGADDCWTFENENVYVCEHEPISIGRGAIRQISSIPTRLIEQVEVVK
jgi:hypothetical protein